MNQANILGQIFWKSNQNMWKHQTRIQFYNVHICPHQLDELACSLDYFVPAFPRVESLLMVIMWMFLRAPIYKLKKDLKIKVWQMEYKVSQSLINSCVKLTRMLIERPWNALIKNSVIIIVNHHDGNEDLMRNKTFSLLKK